jgi:hypothetical protein
MNNEIMNNEQLKSIRDIRSLVIKE